MNYYLVGLLLPVLSFLLQSYPRLFNRFFGVDVWTRLLETDHVRNHHHRIPREKLAGQFIIDGYFDYPPVFPWLMSFISRDVIKKIQGFVAPFFDSFQVYFVFVIAYLLTQNVVFALVAQAIYVLTPIIVIENSYLTPRSLGYFIFSFTTICTLFAAPQGSWFWLTGAVLGSTLLFLTHRFAVQSFLFLSVFFTFFLDTVVFMKVFLVGFALAVVLTRGYYLRVLKGHLFNIYFWVCNLDFRYAHQVRGIVKKDTKVDTVNKMYLILSMFSPFAIFGLNPWAFSGVAAVALHLLGVIRLSSIMQIFTAWILFFYVFGVVVLKVRKLMPIGEGYRYMEFATVPSSILTAYLFFNLAKQFPPLIVFGFLALLALVSLGTILFMQVKTIIQDKNRSLSTEWMQMYAYIDSLKTPPRLVCIPHQNTTMTVYNSKAAVVVNADNPGLMRLDGVYPILTKTLGELTKEYSLTHALVNETFVTLSELGLSKNQVEHVSGTIQLVKLTPSS